jgi:hypothetical protein
MPVYQCPVTKQRGHFHVDSFYEWAQEYFGEFHTWEEDDVLPLPCYKIFILAGKPQTHEAFVVWMKKKYPTIKVPDDPEIGLVRERYRPKKPPTRDRKMQRALKNLRAVVKQQKKVIKKAKVSRRKNLND